MRNDGGVWRWNVDPVWHHHSSMIQEAVLSTEAVDDFTKYHHLRGCFYFGIGALEAFLNKQMRSKLMQDGLPEEKIFKKLRQTTFKTKRECWPSAICEKEVQFPNEYSDIISSFNALRGEITHPKAKDHGIYKDLDEVNPKNLVESISCSIVYVYQELTCSFPYWLLGWNYVGMNGDIAYPSLSNNLNGFIWSLAHMGFGVPTGDDRAVQWEKENMTSVSGYNILRDKLDAYPEEMEPFRIVCGPTPRLTKRWWDRKYILERTPEKYRNRVRYG
ncbi:MAG: hypothetical protein AB7D07_15360 [Desulfovibrionaceae bacterium]